MTRPRMLSAAAMTTAALLVGTLAFAEEVADMMDSGLMDTGGTDTGGEDTDTNTMDTGGMDTGYDYTDRRCPGRRIIACCDETDLQNYATEQDIPLEEVDSYMCADDLLNQALAPAGLDMQTIFDEPERICDNACAPLAEGESTWADVNQYSSGYTSNSCGEDTDRTIIDIECYAAGSP